MFLITKLSMFLITKLSYKIYIDKIKIKQLMKNQQRVGISMNCVCDTSQCKFNFNSSII